LTYERKHIDEKILLFIDEIHRFTKAQKDLLLPDVENESIGLIGATTHNPGF
jgi:putative ATPase